MLVWPEVANVVPGLAQKAPSAVSSIVRFSYGGKISSPEEVVLLFESSETAELLLGAHKARLVDRAVLASANTTHSSAPGRQPCH